MGDIELVIKIPKEKYLYAKNLVNGGKENNPVVLAIGNGTLLPKGHGRLVDVKDLKKNLVYMSDSMFSDAKGVWEEDIDDAETIIKADKTEGEET